MRYISTAPNAHIMEPTDRSMPPEMMIKHIPSAITPAYVLLRRIFSHARPIAPNIPPTEPILIVCTTHWISTMISSAKIVENIAFCDQLVLNQPIALPF